MGESPKASPSLDVRPRGRWGWARWVLACLPFASALGRGIHRRLIFVPMPGRRLARRRGGLAVGFGFGHSSTSALAQEGVNGKAPPNVGAGRTQVSEKLGVG